jgi:NAD(P)-dependent dehydrogenase (short-subunit alcohol dehydrogenase family)
VAVWDLTGDEAANVAESLPVPAVGIGLDVTDRSAVEQALTTTRQALPSIGGLVHSAGIVFAEAVGSIDWGHWDRLLSVNLTAHAYLTQLLLPDLRRHRGSAVVAISSMDGVIAHPSIPAYCSAKSGLLGLTRSLAAALGPEGIRANAVCPGYIATPMLGPDDSERTRSMELSSVLVAGRSRSRAAAGPGCPRAPQVRVSRPPWCRHRRLLLAR